MHDVTKEDLVLLLLAAPGEAPRGEGQVAGITRLAKLVFLAQNDLKPVREHTEAFAFRPQKFGPFSEEIYGVADTLCSLGLIDVYERNAGSYPDLEEGADLEAWAVDDDAEEVVLEKVFTITDRGRSVVDVLRKRGDVPDSLWQSICGLKDRFGRWPLTRLIYHVYQKYPQMTTESVLNHLKPRF